MAKRVREENPAGRPDVVEEQPGLERFLAQYRNVLIGLGVLVLVVVLGWLAYKELIVGPAEEEASREIFRAQSYLEADSLDLALYGDPVNLGFVDIADEYGMTETGNLANYYAGIILLRKGEYEQALEHLEEFDTESVILEPLKLGAMGDAYSQLGDLEQAASKYMEAAQASKNDYTAPKFLMKAGLMYEELGQFQDAIEAYETIEKQYPESTLAGNIVKYVARARAAAYVSEE